MDRIINCDILDILPCEEGFLYVEREDMPDGKARAKFMEYHQQRNELLPIPSKVYLEYKFGREYKEITAAVGDFISCDSARLTDDGVVTLSNDGNMIIFNYDGSSAWSGKVKYQDEPVRDIAVDGKTIWCTVPGKNAIICYSPLDGRVLLRIGGGRSVAFSDPVALVKYDNKLYISNSMSYKVRTIRLDDYSVKDYLKFKEPVYKYFRSGENEYVMLKSGVYII